MKQLLCCIFFSSIFFTACKKYEENPMFLLSTKNHRIQGVYKIAFYSVNGVSLTKEVNDSLTVDPYLVGLTPTFSFNKKGHDEEISGNWFQGRWHLGKNKEYLTIDLRDITGASADPFVSFGMNDWEITKLTEHHMHLQITNNNNVYILHLHE